MAQRETASGKVSEKEDQHAKRVWRYLPEKWSEAPGKHYDKQKREDENS